MINVRHLTKRYGRFKAVDGLSFNVAEGEAVALWGPNGAGKTTIIRCLLGLHRYGGSITIAGLDLRRHGRAAHRAVGYVPQELAFYDDFRVSETLAFFAALKRAPRERVRITLEEVGLTAHACKRVRELSGGMKQRLALACALLSNPPLLLLDELTSNLDAQAQTGFMALLADLRRRGKTILFTSHRLDEVTALAERVLVLEDGRLQREATPSELAGSSDERCILKVFVTDVDGALKALSTRGFTAALNGRGVHVVVPRKEKASPIRALVEASIDVHDFDIAPGDALLPPHGRTSP